MDHLIHVHEREITINFELGRKCRATLHLRNLMHTMPVAFKLQTTSPDKFYVRPPNGFILPLAELTLEIILKPQTALPPCIPYCHERFVLKTTLPPVNTSDISASLPERVPDGWFNPTRNQVFTDGKLRVVYIGAFLLGYSISNQDVHAVEQILVRQKNNSNVDDEGRSALHIAASIGNLELVAVLLRFGVNINAVDSHGRTPLWEAVSGGKSEVVKELLERGALTKIKDSMNKTDCIPVLHVAAAGDSTQILKHLIRHRAYLEVRDLQGRTALYSAVESGKINNTKILLAAGADQNAVTFDGKSALYLAAEMGLSEMAYVLLDNGANPHIRANNGQSAFDIAALKGHVQILDAIHTGEKLLDVSRQGDANAVVSLLQKHVNFKGLCTTDNAGWTALHVAAFKGHANIVQQLLLSDGASKAINLRDKDGHTPLHCAAESGSITVLELLLAMGADPMASNNRGARPSDLAFALGYTQIARLLQYHEVTQGIQDPHSIQKLSCTRSLSSRQGVSVTSEKSHNSHAFSSRLDYKHVSQFQNMKGIDQLSDNTSTGRSYVYKTATSPYTSSNYSKRTSVSSTPIQSQVSYNSNIYRRLSTSSPFSRNVQKMQDMDSPEIKRSVPFSCIPKKSDAALHTKIVYTSNVLSPTLNADLNKEKIRSSLRPATSLSPIRYHSATELKHSTSFDNNEDSDCNHHLKTFSPFSDLDSISEEMYAALQQPFELQCVATEDFSKHEVCSLNSQKAAGTERFNPSILSVEDNQYNLGENISPPYREDNQQLEVDELQKSVIEKKQNFAPQYEECLRRDAAALFESEKCGEPLMNLQNWVSLLSNVTIHTDMKRKGSPPPNSFTSSAHFGHKCMKPLRTLGLQAKTTSIDENEYSSHNQIQDSNAIKNKQHRIARSASLTSITWSNNSSRRNSTSEATGTLPDGMERSNTGKHSQYIALSECESVSKSHKKYIYHRSKTGKVDGMVTSRDHHCHQKDTSVCHSEASEMTNTDYSGRYDTPSSTKDSRSRFTPPLTLKQLKKSGRSIPGKEDFPSTHHRTLARALFDEPVGSKAERNSVTPSADVKPKAAKLIVTFGELLQQKL